MIEHLRRFGYALADWWFFQMGTVSGWLHPPPATSLDRAIREEGERLRKAFPFLDERTAGLKAARRQDLMLERGDCGRRILWVRARRAIKALQAAPTNQLRAVGFHRRHARRGCRSSMARPRPEKAASGRAIFGVLRT
jgi:hypothetical protein